MDVKDVARSDQFVLRIRDFDEPYAKQDFFRMAGNGAILRVAHGAYVVVPERHRRPDLTWRPPLEQVALGIASAAFGPDEVALLGPSAARAHGVLPRPLAVATVSSPSTRPRVIETLVGVVRTYRRTIDQMDVVHLNNDIVRGLSTSIEMTLLDLASKAPKWPIVTSDRDEAIRLLGSRADWALVTELATRHRKRSALKRALELADGAP